MGTGKKVKTEAVPDYLLSRLQDDIISTVELAQDLEARINSLRGTVEEIKRVLGLPAEALSLRNEDDFLE